MNKKVLLEVLDGSGRAAAGGMGKERGKVAGGKIKRGRRPGVGGKRKGFEKKTSRVSSGR